MDLFFSWCFYLRIEVLYVSSRSCTMVSKKPFMNYHIDNNEKGFSSRWSEMSGSVTSCEFSEAIVDLKLSSIRTLTCWITTSGMERKNISIRKKWNRSLTSNFILKIKMKFLGFSLILLRILFLFYCCCCFLRNERVLFGSECKSFVYICRTSLFGWNFIWAPLVTFSLYLRMVLPKPSRKTGKEFF